MADNPNPTHTQVTRQTPWGEVVEVDEGLAWFLEELWQRNVRTFYSCQGMGQYERPYVVFDAHPQWQWQAGTAVVELIHKHGGRIERVGSLLGQHRVGVDWSWNG